MSDRHVRGLPHLYILIINTRNHGHFSKFEGHVTYANLFIPELHDNIPDDLCRSVCSKSESKASSMIE